MRLKFNHKQLGATAGQSLSVVLVYLRMHGIPLAVGGSTYLFIGVAGRRSTMCKALSGFCFLLSPPSAFHCVSV